MPEISDAEICTLYVNAIKDKDFIDKFEDDFGQTLEDLAFDAIPGDEFIISMDVFAGVLATVKTFTKELTHPGSTVAAELVTEYLYATLPMFHTFFVQMLQGMDEVHLDTLRTYNKEKA